MSVKIVEPQLDISTKVGLWLKKKSLGENFVLADEIGNPLDSPYAVSLPSQQTSPLGKRPAFGLLGTKPEPTRERHLFARKRKPLMGIIWFNSELRGATEGARWVFEVFGRKYLESLRKLAEEMSTAFSDIEISLELKDELRFENSDDGGF